MRKHIIGSYTSVIGIHLPGVVWQFTLLWGLAFGLESAVVNFNRWPMLAIAANRGCTCAVTAACFDGELFVDFLIRHDVSGPGLRCILESMGYRPQPSRDFVTEGLVRLQPKYRTSYLPPLRLASCLGMMLLNFAEASNSMCAGRLSGPVLSIHQAFDDPSVQSSELRLLRLLSPV